MAWQEPVHARVGEARHPADCGRPKRPQTLGKVERFWGTLWRECVESAVFVDLEDARRRIGLFIDHYNFQRVHSGIDGLVPADRFFHAAPEVLSTLKQRVVANALELARHGVPKKPFYLTGQVQGQPFSVHQAGDRVILRQAGQDREEIALVPPPVAPNVTSDELPPPVCPQGIPASYGELPEELPPGVSGLNFATPRSMLGGNNRAVSRSMEPGRRQCNWSPSTGNRVAARRDALAVSPRTLAHWRSSSMRGQLTARLRGRPCREATHEQRTTVTTILDETGPRLGLPTLRACCPATSPSILAYLLKNHRRKFQADHQQKVESLHWLCPGTVWAIDHSQPPHPIDGHYRQSWQSATWPVGCN